MGVEGACSFREPCLLLPVGYGRLTGTCGLRCDETSLLLCSPMECLQCKRAHDSTRLCVEAPVSQKL